MKKRLLYFDTIKFFAAIWIFLTHFLSSFRPSLFRLWSDFPSSLILHGLNGKFAAAVFAVILGYFAYQKGTRNQKLSLLIIKRYISFFVMGLFMNVIYILYVERANPISGLLYYWKEILFTSLKLSDRFYAIFWFFPSFFWGSVLSYINGKYKMSPFPVLIQIFMLALTQNLWIAICLMGNILYIITDENFSNSYIKNFIIKPQNQVFVLLFVFILFQRPNAESTHFIDGICSVLILSVIAYNTKLQKLFDNTLFSYLGKYSMGIMLMHPMILSILGHFYPLFPDNRYTLMIAFCISVLLTIPLSILIVHLINLVSRFLENVYTFLEKTAVNAFYHMAGKAEE